MRIAVWHNLPSGGGKRALYDHVRGLIARGHEVEAWCPPTADRAYLPLSELVTEHVVSLSETSTAPTHNPYRDMVARLREMDRHCRVCAEQIDRGGFDVVLVHPCRFFRAAPVGKYASIPSVLYLQEPYRWLYEALPQLPWLARVPSGGNVWWKSRSFVRQFPYDLLYVYGLRQQARAEYESAKAFDAILVNSLFSRESVLRAYGLDARLCYLGVDPGHFVDQGGERHNTAVGIGAFVPEKNIHFIIEAIGQVPSPLRPRLVWIGNVADENYLRDLTALARERGVDFAPRVRISDEEIVAVMNAARLFVYAPRLEPFGYAPLEANACGLPVVAVAEGGVRETVVDGVNGLLSEPDARSMACCIQRLLEDPGLAAELADNGKRGVAGRWSFEASIDRLERRLFEVLDGGRAGGNK